MRAHAQPLTPRAPKARARHEKGARVKRPVPRDGDAESALSEMFPLSMNGPGAGALPPWPTRRARSTRLHLGERVPDGERGDLERLLVVAQVEVHRLLEVVIVSELEARVASSPSQKRASASESGLFGLGGGGARRPGDGAHYAAGERDKVEVDPRVGDEQPARREHAHRLGERDLSGTNMYAI